VTANKEKTMKLARIAVLAAAVAAATAFIGVGLPEGAKGSADQPGHTITVNGSGTSTTVPDETQFCFDVEDHADTAEAASAANAAAMQKVIAALRKAGVADKDLQTVNVSVEPQYNDAGTKVLGYTASNSVCATTSVADAGSVAEAVLGAGADRISGPNLTKADSTKLYDDALRAAVADARSRAEVLADAGGVEVGAVVSIQEGSEPSYPVAYDLAMASPEAPIEAGTQDIEATVTVTYAIA
jgi:uncharacterized protein YggE